MVDSFNLARCREHIVGEVVNLVIRPLVEFQVRLHVTPLGLKNFGVILLLIDERNSFAQMT
jgi:hypothetical protein